MENYEYVEMSTLCEVHKVHREIINLKFIAWMYSNNLWDNCHIVL